VLPHYRNRASIQFFQDAYENGYEDAIRFSEIGQKLARRHRLIRAGLYLLLGLILGMILAVAFFPLRFPSIPVKFHVPQDTGDLKA